jgi:hypothetical protein
MEQINSVEITTGSMLTGTHVRINEDIMEPINLLHTYVFINSKVEPIIAFDVYLTLTPLQNVCWLYYYEPNSIELKTLKVPYDKLFLNVKNENWHIVKPDEYWCVIKTDKFGEFSDFSDDKKATRFERCIIQMKPNDPTLEISCNAL